jgi:hypothetical protein
MRTLLLALALLLAAGAAEARAPSGLFGEYRRQVDRLTALAYQGHRETIDPLGLRGRKHGHDLDHATSVRCGFAYGWPPERVAAIDNLRIIPASVNRSDGARGCRGVDAFFDG